MDHISVTTLVQAYKLTTAVDDIGSGNHCNHLGRVPFTTGDRATW